MLPPHRPFRNRPEPNATVKPNPRCTVTEKADINVQATRRRLKPELVVLENKNGA